VLTAGARGALLAAATMGCVAATGCGGLEPVRPSQPAALPVSHLRSGQGMIPAATPADYRAPVAVYRRHVARALRQMAGDVRELRRGVASTDLGAARSAWRAANARYQTVGAAYGAFGALDQAIDGSTAGLARGVHNPRFRGLHRVELALFGRSSTADARRPAAQLARSVARLRATLGDLRIDPLEYSLRAHEIIEDTLHEQLTGRASPWSGAAFDAVAANVRGTRVVLRTLEPLLRQRAPARLVQAEQSLTDLQRALAPLRRGSGYVALGRATRAERARVNALTASAAERLAYVPEVIDPRPARAIRNPFGETR